MAPLIENREQVHPVEFPLIEGSSTSAQDVCFGDLDAQKVSGHKECLLIDAVIRDVQSKVSELSGYCSCLWVDVREGSGVVYNRDHHLIGNVAKKLRGVSVVVGMLPTVHLQRDSS